jgi:hypothetical protein
MTALGKTILIGYSILALIILMALSVRKLEKGRGKGLEAVMLMPIFILLLNLI